MARLILSDRKIASLKPAVADTLIMDVGVPGLGVRVSPRGKKTFVVVARFGGKHPARRSLGEYGRISLAEAREKARSWLELVNRGIDPATVEERAREEERRYQAATFGVVAERFIEKHVSHMRTAKAMARTIRSELISKWTGRPIGDITKADVINLIEAIAARPAPYQAHATFELLRSLFNWVVDREEFGIEASPCDRIKVSRLVSAKEPRDRVLDDAEIAALWRVTDRLGFPYGHLYKVLLLTGVRRNEAAAAKWDEFDLDKRVWTIPTERFKSKTPHVVPLTDATVAVLGAIPEHHSAYAFSSARFNFALAKAEVDRLLAEELGHQPQHWKTHDIRRTVRTRLASLKVVDHVAEMVLGHGRRGLQRVYDQHSYGPEMREALELWAARLRDIVTPPPDNVTQLPRRA
jgi:integrase